MPYVSSAGLRLVDNSIEWTDVFEPVTRRAVFISAAVGLIAFSLPTVVTVNNFTSTYQLKNDYFESFANFNRTTQFYDSRKDSPQLTKEATENEMTSWE